MSKRTSRNVTDWDTFQFTVRVDASMLRQLVIEMEAYRLAIQRQPVPPEWAEDLRHLNIVRAVHGTTAIEGNPLSEQEVAKALKRVASKADATVNGQAERQVENAYRAHKWVQSTFSEPGHPIQLEEILHIHRLLTERSDEVNNQPGRLRGEGHEVTVGSPDLGSIHRGAPGGHRLRELMDCFVEALNSGDVLALNPVERALWAHFYLVTIHPFGDGNGRAARGVEAAILFESGYNTHGFFSLSNHFYAEREAYIHLLQRTRAELTYDLTEFFAFGLRGFVGELERISSYLRRRTERLMYRELIRRCHEIRVGKRRRLLNDREASLLHHLLDSTPPPSPFTDEPEQSVTTNDLLNSQFFRLNYGNVTWRTVNREFDRLAKLGFVQYRTIDPDDSRIELDFTAISKY